MLSTYQQRPMYMPSWGPQMMYPNGDMPSMPSPSQLQYMFQNYQRSQMQPNPQMVQQYSNSQEREHSDSLMARTARRGDQEQSYRAGAIGHSPLQHGITGPMFSGSPSQNSKGSQHTGSPLLTGTSSSASVSMHGSTPTHGSAQFAHVLPMDGMWPPWGVNPQQSNPYLVGGAGYSEAFMTPEKGLVSTEFGKDQTNEADAQAQGDGRWQESKRTKQRRIQREAKTAFTRQSEQWPQRILCTASGEIPKNFRAFVHAQFRATARRILKLDVIHFRDHPDSDINQIESEISKRFVFDPPIRKGYVMYYIEESIRSVRYQWRKHWVDTGKGSKHRLCPMKYFPSLVAYWRTAAAEEESQKMKAARASARNARALRIQNGDLNGEDEDEAWDVSNFLYLYVMRVSPGIESSLFPTFSR